ncbi:hypothetical protein C1A38_11380 [Verrucosispora sp. ts21]|nr:hypothetical protein C1A38_11380 [Verrucosispora sp. ts21]
MNDELVVQFTIDQAELGEVLEEKDQFAPLLAERLPGTLKQQAEGLTGVVVQADSPGQSLAQCLIQQPQRRFGIQRNLIPQDAKVPVSTQFSAYTRHTQW